MHLKKPKLQPTPNKINIHKNWEYQFLPSQSKQTLDKLIAEGTVKPVSTEAAACLLNGAALNAALWIAASPEDVVDKEIEAFLWMIDGRLRVANP